MSLFGTMKTAVSGMNAQANKLGTVGDNIANSSTTGYKSASTSFSSMVLPSTSGNYNSGGVSTTTNYSISTQGALTSTTSSTDLAISGDGFFVVQDTAGNIFLTRSGSFTADETGNLVNDAGFTLLGYEYNGTTPTTVINSYDGLVPVNISSYDLSATASTSGTLKGNLNSAATVVDSGDLPSDNSSTVNIDQSSTLKTSLTTYDALGNSVKYDFYFSKTDEGEWEVSVYNAADASSTGGFPYSSDAITTDSLSFSDTGELLNDPATIDVDGISIDLSGMSQLSSASSITSGTVDGNAAEAVKSISISSDGTVSATYATSSARALYQIPLADVASPDNLTVLSGNVYQTNSDSGVVTLGFAGSDGFGEISAGKLETSNVDLATELTEMIQAQRSYSANSKVFQTGSDLMETLINLVR